MQRPSKDEIGELLHPSSSDISLSKEVVMGVLCEARVVDKRDLLVAVLETQKLDAQGLEPGARREQSWEDQARHLRWQAAGRMALAELQGEGLALPMTRLEAEQTIHVHGRTTVGQSSQTWGEPFDDYDVALAQRYRASAKALSFEGSGFLLHDPDLYLARVDAAAMHPRVAIMLQQSVGCYRSALYAGASVLLGAASEGAWMELARVVSDRLGDNARQLRQELSKEAPQAAEVQARVDNAVRSQCQANLKEAGLNLGRWGNIVDRATTYRRYRNYALHFREDELEELNYASAGMLLLNATNYFNALYRLGTSLSDDSG